MVSLRKAAFVVALKPLLQGRVRILSISAEGADLLLETRSDGRGNWVFDTPPAEPADASAAGPQVALDMLAATDAVVSYRDGATGVTRTLAVRSLEVEAAGESSQLQADITLDGQRLPVGGQSGRFEALAAARAAWPFDLQVQTDGATLTAKGELGAAKPRIEAHVTAASIDVGRWPPAPGAAGKPPPPPAAGQNTGKKAPLFGDAPLPWPTLPDLPISLDLRVERLPLPSAPPLSVLTLTAAPANWPPWAWPAPGTPLGSQAAARFRSGVAVQPGVAADKALVLQPA